MRKLYLLTNFSATPVPHPWDCSVHYEVAPSPACCWDHSSQGHQRLARWQSQWAPWGPHSCWDLKALSSLQHLLIPASSLQSSSLILLQLYSSVIDSSFPDPLAALSFQSLNKEFSGVSLCTLFSLCLLSGMTWFNSLLMLPHRAIPTYFSDCLPTGFQQPLWHCH